MSKGLEALRDFENHFKTSSWAKETDFTMICFEIEKELKAFDIIKEKRVDCFMLIISQSVDAYNKDCGGIEEDKLTQEEYDLLKEALL